MINTHSWNTPMKDEPSITPPPMTIVETLFNTNYKSGSQHKGKHGSKDVSLEKKKNQKKPDGKGT